MHDVRPVLGLDGTHVMEDMWVLPCTPPIYLDCRVLGMVREGSTRGLWRAVTF